MITSEEEKPYKEILYLLLEKIRATKAAFYLLEPGGAFSLLTQYGFSKTDRYPDRVTRTDPLAQTVFERREPWFLNDPRAAGRLQPLLEAASSTRILTAPLYLNGRIVGLLDVRDKAGRAPFGAEDVEWVQEVCRRLAMKVHAHPRFSGPVVKAETESPFGSPSAGDNRARSGVGRAETAPVATGGADSRRPLVEEPAQDYLPSGTARTLRVVQETLERAATSTRPTPTLRGPSQREIGFYHLYLQACLAFPDVEIAALANVGARDVIVTLASHRPAGPDVELAIAESLEKVHARSGISFPMPESRAFNALPGTRPDAPPIGRGEIAAIQSSVLLTGTDELAVLALVLRGGLTAEEASGLAALHTLLKTSLADLREAGRYREAFRGLVNKMLEPGLRKYTALKLHSLNVGRMARKFAAHLRLSPTEVEQVTVAGILHDVGMKDLNYDELYTKKSLTDEERMLIREHPRVGATLLADVPWPYDVVPLVRHHHERWDGQGYPDGLRGENIPLGARIIHLCEAFDAMTSPQSYRAVISAYQALDILESKGGTQFDPELAPAFKRLVEGMKS